MKVTKVTKTFLVCPNPSNLDLLFVLDGSSSVQTRGFQTIINWVKEVSRNLIEQANYSIQIGVIQFSYEARSVVKEIKIIQI